MTEELSKTILSLRPALRTHGGDISVVTYDAQSGSVEVELTGLCASCPIKPLTSHATVIPVLEQVPGVTSVTVRGARVSTMAQKRIEQALNAGGLPATQET